MPACEYCGSDKDLAQLEVRNDRLVCRDVEACDEAEAEHHRLGLSELRRVEALTDAEHAELAA